MEKHQEKQKKQDLGIFYTPPEVVNFVFDILNIWKEREDKEDKRWQSREPKPHYPSVIDPAVGEGVFLKGALENNFTKPNYIFGIDINETVTKKWEEINLLTSFGSRANLENHFFHQNGLLPLEDKILRYKTGGLKEFDVVVGNPPYGGIGVDLKGKATPQAIELLNALAKYEIIPAKNKKTVVAQNNQTIISLPMSYHVVSPQLPLTDIANRADGIPIETLFIERFIQLVKPGGWIAVIIPDGILSNSNAHYVRDFIVDKTKVEAIISLPRETFKQAGTNAKTSVLFLRKLTKNEKTPLEYPVFLATAEKVSKDDFQKIVKDYISFYK